MDYEHAVLSKAIRISDIKPLLDYKITPEFFDDGEHSQVYSWIIDHWSKYGAVPSPEALSDNFPTWELLEVSEPFDYYIDKLREKHAYGKLHTLISESRDLLAARDVRGTMNALSTGLNDVIIDASPLLDVDITQTTDIRIAEYLALGELDGGLRGIPSGFPTIDLATAGLQPEQLITLVGPPKSGKSTIAMLVAIAAHEAGKVPLFLSFEMSNAEQAARHDAFRAGISHHALLTGKMNPAQEKRLRRYLEFTKTMKPFYMSGDISGTTTISGIGAKVEQYKPDLLIIDGAYLLESEIGHDPNSPQALTEITRRAKKLAQREKIPIFITTQVLTWKMSKKSGITADSIGYSSSFAQDSDVVLGIQDVKDEENIAELSIVIARNAPKKKVLIQFDFEVGAFKELGEPKEDDYDDIDS